MRTDSSKCLTDYVCSVSRWCTNNSQPDLETQFRIADILNVDVRELINADKK